VHLAPFEPPEHDEAVVLDEGDIVRLAYIRRPGLAPADVFERSPRWLELLKLPAATPQARMVDSIWDLIHWNEESLVEDYAQLEEPSAQHLAGPHHMLNEQDVWLGPDVTLMPGCVLDASKGAVMIAANAVIGANAVITGPCYIGPYSRIRPLTQLREGTSVGTYCTIGGEVSQSIFLDYSNKAHEGFVGHSYVGKWANLGSGTTTSNLKNTYGEIRAIVAGKEVATGRQFLGAAIGDHAKTGILTRLMSGTYLGFGSMLAMTLPAPKLVPSFTFLTDAGSVPYAMDKAIEVTKRVFARRDRGFNTTDEELMRYVAKVAPAVEGSI
jgi:UDP-N-acetylglucosamine diphosphorylase/glucosamine-1-phosphate N-acetyltransferase